MRFRFLHAGDVHLDTPPRGIHRIDTRLAEMLRDATMLAYQNLVDAAVEREAAFLLIAGDVYDGPRRGIRAQLAFRDGLERLTRAGIPTLIVHGNHDPIEEGWSAVRAWPERVTVFGSCEVVCVPVSRDGETLAVVHGISYSQRAVTENLSRRFRRSGAQCLQIGILHCNVGANADHDPYSPCSVEDLLAAGLDYWALGHVHSRQTIRPGDPWVAYPGNLQGLSLKASECGAKGALLVEVDENQVTDVAFLPLDVLRYHHIHVDIAETADIASLSDALADAAMELGASQDGRTVVVRAALSGRGVVHTDLVPVRLQEVVDRVRATLMSSAPLVWLDGVDDQSRPDLALDDLRGRGDFAADLIATADRVLASAALSPNLLEAHLDDLPAGELRRLLGEEVGAAPSEDEIRRGLDLALDHVAGTDS